MSSSCEGAEETSWFRQRRQKFYKEALTVRIRSIHCILMRASFFLRAGSAARMSSRVMVVAFTCSEAIPSAPVSANAVYDVQ